jgi:hypothetical protein
MTRLLRRVGLLLVPLLAGCGGDDKLKVLQPGSGPGATAQAAKVAHAPATEEAALRVVNLGRKLVDANPQLTLRPTFICIGAPQPVLFHRLNKDACEVFVSEGLVRQCQGDGQLAAALCTELGRVVAERAALASPALRQGWRETPPSVPVGRDESDAFGGPDRTRLAELARLDAQRQPPSGPPPAPPKPEALAKVYLTRAGFAATDLDAVAGLLRATEQDATFEKQLTGGR